MAIPQLSALSRMGVRRASSPGARAEAPGFKRVAEYLRVQGLADEGRLGALARAIAEGARSADAAVASAQERVEAWRSAAFGPGPVDPLWLRAFIAAHPELFLGDARLTAFRARVFGNPRAGYFAARTRFRRQEFERLRIAPWLWALLPPLSLTLMMSLALLHALSLLGLTTLELIWVAIGTCLFALTSLGAWICVLGFSAARERWPAQRREQATQPLPRTAVVIPVYHEDAHTVFAAIQAMRESLLRLHEARAFEFFVLSDSQQPAFAAEEEAAFRRIAAEPCAIPVYYRRRIRNHRHKAGNLADFFERWGHRYVYAVVLDADSIMEGATLVELARRMEAAPGVALLQAPLVLHGARTLFARQQQFVVSLLGPLFLRGLARVAGPHGNYYGHNAIVRVRAFLDCCALPTLEGAPPLGGHILSHDFVEAALLCRAGWEVRIAHDLSGSWEQGPPTFADFVARDRRWCQGNLQHLRIVWSEGLKPMSRLHMITGAGSYLAGPLWVAFVALSVILSTRADFELGRGRASFLLGVTAAVLLAPRVLGLLAALRQPLRGSHGGPAKLACSVLLETLVSSLLAPILMLHHTRIIASIFRGKAVRWGAQNRATRAALRSAARSELVTTLAGASLLVGAWWLTPALVPWLMPVAGPWLCAIGLVAWASSERVGSWMRRLGLFLTPAEATPDPLLARARALRVLAGRDEVSRFRDLVLDPALLAAHIARLPRAPSAGADEEARERAFQCAVSEGPSALSAEQRALLASDAERMRKLHREAWRHWPVESWAVGHDIAQLPCEP